MNHYFLIIFVGVFAAIAVPGCLDEILNSMRQRRVNALLASAMEANRRDVLRASLYNASLSDSHGN